MLVEVFSRRDYRAEDTRAGGDGDVIASHLVGRLPCNYIPKEADEELESLLTQRISLLDQLLNAQYLLVFWQTVKLAVRFVLAEGNDWVLHLTQ